MKKVTTEVTSSARALEVTSIGSSSLMGCTRVALLSPQCILGMTLPKSSSPPEPQKIYKFSQQNLSKSLGQVCFYLQVQEARQAQHHSCRDHGESRYLNGSNRKPRKTTRPKISFDRVANHNAKGTWATCKANHFVQRLPK